MLKTELFDIAHSNALWLHSHATHWRYRN